MFTRVLVCGPGTVTLSENDDVRDVSTVFNESLAPVVTKILVTIEDVDTNVSVVFQALDDSSGNRVV